jgi:hypothetical protein
MSIRISVRIQARCLHVLAQGRFTLVSAQRSFAEVLETAVQHHICLILLDGRRITGEPSTIDRFFYAKFAALAVALARQRHGAFKPRFAYVLSEPVLDPRRFGETVAVNRGLSVKAFDTLEAARIWLGLTSEHPSTTTGTDSARFPRL